jgi:carbon-monoxide dehydrogenase large subunit
VGAAGVSLGAPYAARTAAFEPRIRAVAGISGPYDLSEACSAMPGLTREAFTLVATPIETRGCIAEHDPRNELLTVWCSAQDTHRPLEQLAHILDRPADSIHLIVPDVGGAFGAKGVIAPEIAAVAAASIELGPPLKWVEDRFENFLAAYQGRGIEGEVELALDRDGRMLGVRARLWADLGAYLLTTTAIPAHTAAMLLTGCYDIPAAEVTIVGGRTHKVPMGPYRGAGRPDAAYMIERLVDDAARALELDRIELRRRNLIRRFPHRTPLGYVYDSGDYERCIDVALDLAGGLVCGRERTEHDPDRVSGTGLAVFVERAGGRWEAARPRSRPAGVCSCAAARAPTGRDTTRRSRRSPPTGSGCRSGRSRCASATAPRFRAASARSAAGPSQSAARL